MTPARGHTPSCGEAETRRHSGTTDPALGHKVTDSASPAYRGTSGGRFPWVTRQRTEDGRTCHCSGGCVGRHMENTALHAKWKLSLIVGPDLMTPVPSRLSGTESGPYHALPLPSREAGPAGAGVWGWGGRGMAQDSRVAPPRALGLKVADLFPPSPDTSCIASCAASPRCWAR